jgi:hypothetical protein
MKAKLFCRIMASFGQALTQSPQPLHNTLSTKTIRYHLLPSIFKSIQQVISMRFTSMEHNQQTGLEETHYSSTGCTALVASAFFSSYIYDNTP